MMLDDLIPLNKNIKFIKIDVEGAELGVLKGGFQTIKNSKLIIVFEHGIGAADYYGTTPEQIFSLLVNECGLRIFIMEQWLATGRLVDINEIQFSDAFRSGREYYFMAAV